MSLIDPFGRRADGRPFWVPAFGDSGGSEGGGSEGDGSGSGTGDGGGDDPVAQKDRTIASISQERNRVRQELRSFKGLAAEFGIQDNHLDGLRTLLSEKAQSGNQQQQASPPVDEDKIRARVQAEVMAEANQRVVRAEVRALAAERFADPDDAVLHLGNQANDFVNDKGEIDTESIKSALADLLRRKKHLAKITEEPPPDFDGGARGTPAGASETFASYMRRQVAAKKGH